MSDAATQQPNRLDRRKARTRAALIRAAQMLIDLIRQCHADGVTLAVARLESTRTQAAFERFGLYDVLPRDRVFRSVDEAVHTLGGMAPA